MPDEKKVIQLTKVEKKEVRTYGKCLQDHLESLEDEQKDRTPLSMLTVAITEDGIVYCCHAGEDISQMIGMLDLAKQYLFVDFLQGE